MWRFWIDTGGTFTDCLATGPNGVEHRAKVLSSSCLRATIVSNISGSCYSLSGISDLPDDFFKGYRFRIYEAARVRESAVVAWDATANVVTLEQPLGEYSGGTLCEFASPEEPPIFAARVVTKTLLDAALPPLEMRLATTRGTNALLERKGAKVAFLVTKGFGDLLRIGNQQRPKLFELGIQKPDPLHDAVIEVEERLNSDGSVFEELNENTLRIEVRKALAAGVESFAIALLHSYLNPIHEQRVETILREEGGRFISVSSNLSPYLKLLPRAETTVVDAYLAPIMSSYLDAVEIAIGESTKNNRPQSSAGQNVTSALRVMTSAGGLVGRGQYHPKDSLLSGPAGGVVGSSQSGLRVGISRTIAFDMGGTSTDVSRFDGEFDYRFEQRIGAARVFAPSLRIETVAAGGGSICWFDGSALRVGPESAGANPGPACYGAGGPLALTDANLLLGRLDESRFGIPVSKDAALVRLQELRREIIEATGEAVSESELLTGFLDIANETMADAIRKVSTSEGYDTSDYALVAFGGAGGLHACAIADILVMDTIIFPANAGLLSADGLRSARMEQFAGRQVLQELEKCLGRIQGFVDSVSHEAIAKLEADGVARAEIALEPVRFEMRYKGQESTLVLEGGETDELKSRFETMYLEQFGFLPQGLAIELVTVRAVARSGSSPITEERIERQDSLPSSKYFVDRDELVGGNSFSGPMVIQDPYSTVFVDTGWLVRVGDEGTLLLEKNDTSLGSVESEYPSASKSRQVVDLELFTNRFLSIVDQMGVLLERVAFSTNVKDRKDFSCALLDPDGYLVANAPHIPVHLGALGVCLREVLKTMTLEPGDVLVTNHPAFGGSHLPDVTLLAPVYSNDGSALLGYVANRAHHAEIGGISPGSMPPNAKNLAEEGVVISPMKLAIGGVVDWQPLLALLNGGLFPSRAVEENVADLSAQLASIRLGTKSLQELAVKEGAVKTVGFMVELKERAANALSNAMEKRLPVTTGRVGSSYIERLDNGAPVCVQVSRQESGKWLIDFEGSAPVQPSNYNATPAIVTSAVIYVLRLLANEEVPLNEGFLDVVDIRTPEGMLNPIFAMNSELCPAVVAGNVELSQLVVSTLIKAFSLAACSQSTMNNLIFGTSEFGYYETIAGGEGATESRDGASGVHTHMTNTAMTDPEVMELRYPVRVEIFSLRKGSGGKGRRKGGNGIIKRIRFLKPVTLSLLTQRRVESPFGLNGGESGECGYQLLYEESGDKVTLPSNGVFSISLGDVLEIGTPGGGGMGVKVSD